MRQRFLSFSLAVLMIVCTVVGTLPKIEVNAAAGVVNIVTEVKGKDSLDKLTVGDVVTVKVVLPEITNTRKFQLDLNYDNSRFEYNGDVDVTAVTSLLSIGDVRVVEDNIIRVAAAGTANASFSAGTVALIASFTVIAGENLGELDAFSLSKFICGDESVSINTTPVKATVKEKDKPVVTVSSVTVEQGGTASITVDLVRNEGIASMGLNIEYDSALTITNVVKGSALSTLNFVVGNNPYGNPLVLLWVGLYDDASSGNLVTITFSVPENAEVREYPVTVTYDSENVFDENDNGVNLVINNGSIEVTERHSCSFGEWAKYDDLYHIHSCACGETEKALHNWNSGTVSVQPDCTAKGEKIYTCVDCEATKTEEMASLGHSYGEWEVTESATCTASGTERRDCVNCDHYETRTVDALGHDVIEYGAKAPTCTEVGWNAYETCSRCDYTTYAEIAATGHSHSAAITDPTCTEQGYTTYTCSCGDSYVSDYVEALGHNYNSVVTPPTITSEGYTTHTCSNCGHSYKDNYVDRIPEENAPAIAVSSETGRAGETVTVTVDMKNNPGFGGMAFDVKYDNTVLELVSYELGLGSSICTPSGIDTYADKMNFQYAGISNITGDGTLVTLTFKVKDDAQEGTTAISVVPEDGTFFKYDNMVEIDISVLCVNGGVEIVNYVKGDINGDGRVNNRDAARLMQYLAGWGVECVGASLDVNGDGRVNNRDAARLMQYLAGWEVELY